MKFVRENVREMSGKNDSEKLCEPCSRYTRSFFYKKPAIRNWASDLRKIKKPGVRNFQKIKKLLG